MTSLLEQTRHASTSRLIWLCPSFTEPIAFAIIAFSSGLGTAGKSSRRAGSLSVFVEGEREVYL